MIDHYFQLEKKNEKERGGDMFAEKDTNPLFKRL